MKNFIKQKPKLAILSAVLFFAVSVLASAFIVFVMAETAYSIESNGSRLVIKSDGNAPVSCQWQISDTQDGEFTNLATGKFYDIKAENEGKYIKAIVDGEETNVVGPIGKLVVFDLSLGTVNFSSTYSGNGGTVTGTHVATNIYVIQQSGDFTTNNVNFSGNLQGKTFDITLDGINLGKFANEKDYGTNTPKGSRAHSDEYDTGTIHIPATNGNIKNIIFRLKGENVVRNIHYYTTNHTDTASTLKITDINGDGATNGGTLYMPVKVEKEDIDSFVQKSTDYNHWNSAIGGDDSTQEVGGLHIAGGTLQILTTYGDNCTAIGAGGNGACKMLISGGDITAHCNGTGTAIGGGIGWTNQGGYSDITITGGKVYAKNHGKIYMNGSNITTPDKTYDKVVGGVAIGSGSSFVDLGKEGKVTIKGGYVEAYGTFGNGIGGGNSSSSTGGEATITITGGTVKASSIGGGDSTSGKGGAATVTIDDPADITLTNGIGGGKSNNSTGGAATITVNGGKLVAGAAIGGGEGSKKGNGGDATVTVNGGYLSAKTIGGGNGGSASTDTGSGGKATVNIHGGTMLSDSIGGGIGSYGGNGGVAEVYVTDGIIKTGSIGGGSTKNPTGQLGYAKAEISGGDIVGQFIMAKGGTSHCTFTMTGGTLHGVDTDDTKYISRDGGAVFMDDPDGVVTISGGKIDDCNAQKGGAIYMSAGSCTISGGQITNCSAQNGGAIYMGGGNLTIKSDEISHKSGEISQNTASDSGGAAYLNGGSVRVSGGSIIGNTAQNSGGGIYVNDGNYRMTGGAVDNNTAKSNAGGGIYVSSNEQDVTVEVASGSVSNNSAKGNGGALAVIGKQDGTNEINVTIGVNKNHFDQNGVETGSCEHGDDGECAYTCPELKNNVSNASGGGVYVTGNTNTMLDIYCLEEEGSHADSDDGQSDFMRMEGGKVTITTSEHEDENSQTDRHGCTHIKSQLYVTGGQMDLWGAMTNPRLEDMITVDITSSGTDYFKDHRFTPDSPKYYKLIYYENFKDPVTQVYKGQYKEQEVLEGTEIEIMSNMYSHPGYEIINWNTKHGRNLNSEGLPDLDYFNQKDFPDKDRGWYEITKKYVFDGKPIGDLEIYAIWKANGYTVEFNANKPDDVDSYSGSMTSINLTYDYAQNLPKNQYGCDGYEFVGWSQSPDGSTEIYADEQSVTNLTTENMLVTLYAQWKKCYHEVHLHDYTYEITDGGKTLKRTCECNAYSEEIHLADENSVYNRATHLPTVVYSSDSWKPAYVITPQDPRDALVDGLPYHAGVYTVTVSETVGEDVYTASATYTVEKAEQTPPEKPSFDSNQEGYGSILSVYPVAKSANDDPTYTSVPQYRLVYYKDGVEYASEWAQDTDDNDTYAAIFELDKALTNYYIQARYSECDNYKASPETAADSVYFFAGDVEFEIVCPEHILYDILTADGTDVTHNGIQIEIRTKDGWYFQNNYHEGISIATTVKKEGDPPPAKNAEISIQGTTDTDGFSDTYSIGNIPPETKVILTLPSAKSNAVILSTIAEKQVFGTVSTTEATITHDSAYTVNFNVQNYDSTEYSPLTVDFKQPLPVGTTVIMQDKTNSKYYWKKIDVSGLSQFNLNEFKLMADKNDTPFEMSDGNIELQFIVDFSHVLLPLDAGELKNEMSTQPLMRAAAASSEKSADLVTADTFVLQNAMTTEGIEYIRNTSNGAASKWDGRENAIVFTPNVELPDDAYLQINGAKRTTDIYANADGKFVYSFADKTADIIRVSLISRLLPEGTSDYQFDAEWFIAKSKAESSYKNGLRVAELETVIHGTQTAKPSLKITARQKTYKIRNDVVGVAEWADTPLNHELTVTLMLKADDGSYSSTGISQSIEFDVTTGEQIVTVPLAVNKAGSYCLKFTAKYDLITVSQSEYYFIVEN